MLLHALGTCAGTEPVAGRHHTAFALELKNGIYWFDAGETCSYTAYLMGVDLLKVRSIFISHTHMDHVGGLGNLMWNIRKVSNVKKCRPLSDTIDVYIPNTGTFDGIMKVLGNTEGGFKCDFSFEPHTVSDGLLYTGAYDDISVTAHHNSHMEKDGMLYRSFSYVIKAEGKTIVFSGDTKLSEINELLQGDIDCFLMETGHHDSGDIARLAQNSEASIKNLFFIHNGRNMLSDTENALSEAKSIFSGNVVVCEDGTSYAL